MESSSQETLKELFNLIDAKKLSKVKAILKADKTLATARQEDNGKNPLLEASSKNNFEVVKLLITTYNVDVNTTWGISKNTPLHEAATNPHIDRESTTQGALGSAKKKDYSVHKDSLKIIQYLIKNDADVNAKNTYDNTPLHAVCIEGLEDCAQALLEAGANIGQRTGTLTKSSTPLHLAAEYSHPNLVRYLIDEGADISLQNSEGKSCLETAMETNVGLSEHHKNKTIDILLEASNGDEYDDDNGERNGNDDGDSDSDNESKNVEQEEDVTSDDINVVENSTEPRLSEDMTGEAARIAAAKGRKAAAAKKKRQKKKKQQEQNDQPKGCKCTIA